MKNIENRISELKKEEDNLIKQIQYLQAETQNKSASLVSVRGGIIELKKLIESDEEE
jgi:hypothetical protein